MEIGIPVARTGIPYGIQWLHSPYHATNGRAFVKSTEHLWIGACSLGCEGMEELLKPCFIYLKANSNPALGVFASFLMHETGSGSLSLKQDEGQITVSLK